MKKQLFLTLFTLLLLSTSCGGSANSPKGIADQFLRFVSKGEYEQAKTFGTTRRSNRRFIAIDDTYLVDGIELIQQQLNKTQHGK
jgi:hypothetical protein